MASTGASQDASLDGEEMISTNESYVVSAPGKVIVFGEHAVVYGKAALAAAISLRSYLHVSPDLPCPSPSVTLDFADISLSHSWSIASLPWADFAALRHTAVDEAPPSLDEDLVAVLAPHVSPISPSLPPEKQKIHHAAATTFLYLYLLLATPEKGGYTFTLRSTIPIGAGLGSSASIAVCLATAFLLLPSPQNASKHARIPLPLSAASSSTSEDYAKQHLDRINEFAYLGESVMHGTPSGVDNTVATLGKAVIFKRSQTPGQPSSITSIRRFPELPLLIVDTKQAKSTHAEVAKVRALRDTYPTVVNPILDAIDAVTESARSLVQQEDEYHLLGKSAHQQNQEDESAKAATAQTLSALVRVNHGLLCSLGVSHPRLEQLRSIVDLANIGAFKLTGSGGGGCGFVLLRPDLGASPALQQAERQVEEAGMVKYETTLGGEGVGVLISGGDDAQIISRDEFLGASGSAALVNLVEDGRSWRYWRF